MVTMFLDKLLSGRVKSSEVCILMVLFDDFLNIRLKMHPGRNHEDI